MDHLFDFLLVISSCIRSKGLQLMVCEIAL